MSITTMPPVVSKKSYELRPLFDPPHGTIHIRDMIQFDQRYEHRTSDLVTGMLLLGVRVNAIQKTQACYFKVTLLPHVKLRTAVYQHDGNAFTGPDGLAMVIDGEVFGGFAGLKAGLYTLDNVDTAPNYVQWVSETLYRGGSIDDTDYSRRGDVPPKRRSTGKPFTQWHNSPIQLPQPLTDVASDQEMDDQDPLPPVHGTNDPPRINRKRAAEEIAGQAPKAKRRSTREEREQDEHDEHDEYGDNAEEEGSENAEADDMAEDGDNAEVEDIAEGGSANEDDDGADDNDDGVVYLMDAYEAGYLGGPPAEALAGVAASALDATDTTVTRHPAGWTPITYPQGVMLTEEYAAHLDAQGVAVEHVVAARQLEDGRTQLKVISDTTEETIAGIAANAMRKAGGGRKALPNSAE